LVGVGVDSVADLSNTVPGSNMEGDSVQNFVLGRRRGMVCRCGSKTTTRNVKLEVVVVLYTPTRHIKPEVVVDT